MLRMPYRQMAIQVEKQLGTRVSHVQIKRDVDALVAQWREEQKPDDRQRWIDQQNMTLDGLEQECVRKRLQDGVKQAEQIMAMVREVMDEKGSGRIERLLRTIVPNGRDMIDTHLNILKRRAALNGSDAPSKLAVGLLPAAVDYTPADAVRYMDAATMGLVAEVDAKVLPESPGGNGAGGNGTGQKD